MEEEYKIGRRTFYTQKDAGEQLQPDAVFRQFPAGIFSSLWRNHYICQCSNLLSTVKRKKKTQTYVDPEYLKKQQASLRHTHRQVIYLNDRELAAIDEYCKQFKVKHKSAMFRQAIMERVLAVLDENHPTLF